jgi:hypothetical protein
MDIESKTTIETTPAELSDEQLLAAASALDAGIPVPEPEPKPETTEPKTEPKDDAKTASGDEEKTVPAPTADKQDPVKEPKADEKKSKYQAAKEKDAAERVRLDNSWKSLQAEKEKLKRERESWEVARQSKPTAGSDTKAKGKAEADVYDELAKGYDDDGETELAALARERAKAIREKADNEPEKAPTQTAQAEPVWKSEGFQKEWGDNAKKIIAAKPDYAKPDNPVNKRVAALLSAPNYAKFFTSHPDGIIVATEVAELLEQAGQIKTLSEQLKEKEAEIATLNKKLGLGATPSAGAASGKKSVDDMTDAEIEAAAIAADNT